MTAYRPLEPLDRPLRLAVLISGGGTTLDNFLRHIQAGTLRAEVALVIASRPDCGGIPKSQAAGLPCVVLHRKEFSSVETYSQAVFEHCRHVRVDVVALAGFLCLLQIPDDFRNRVLNIHPSLIPAFCGRGFHGHHVHEAALARGVKLSGCTVHIADNEYDHGPILVQKAVPVLADDTPDSLAKRVFAAECEAYPEALELYRQGRVSIDGNLALILPGTS